MVGAERRPQVRRRREDAPRHRIEPVELPRDAVFEIPRERRVGRPHHREHPPVAVPPQRPRLLQPADDLDGVARVPARRPVDPAPQLRQRAVQPPPAEHRRDQLPRLRLGEGPQRQPRHPGGGVGDVRQELERGDLQGVRRLGVRVGRRGRHDEEHRLARDAAGEADEQRPHRGVRAVGVVDEQDGRLAGGRGPHEGVLQRRLEPAPAGRHQVRRQRLAERLAQRRDEGDQRIAPLAEGLLEVAGAVRPLVLGEQRELGPEVGEALHRGVVGDVVPGAVAAAGEDEGAAGAHRLAQLVREAGPPPARGGVDDHDAAEPERGPLDRRQHLLALVLPPHVARHGQPRGAVRPAEDERPRPPLGDPAQIGRHRRRRLVPVDGLALHRPEQDLGQRAGHVGVDLPRVARGPAAVRVEDLAGPPAPERPPPHEGLVERRSERVQVRPPVDLVDAHPPRLQRQVGEGAEDDAVVQVRVQAPDARHAEVEELDAALVDDDVGRLDVPVEDAPVVRLGERLAELHAPPRDGPRARDVTPLDHRLQRLAGAVLEGEEDRRAVDAGVDEPDDGGVAELGQGGRLVPHPQQVRGARVAGRRRAPGDLRLEDLQRHGIPRVLRVARREDDGLGAPADHLPEEESATDEVAPAGPFP